MHVSPSRIKQCNTFLALVVVVFGVYLIIQPFIPELGYSIRHSFIFQWLHAPEAERTSNAQHTSQPITPRVAMAAEGLHVFVAPVPADNTLIIPDIDVHAAILEGASAQVLMKGIWHRPGTGTPDTGGNTVLVGHRFLYTSGSNTFYHLDKLKVNDPITVYWKGQRYTYIIDSSTITSADSFEIEQSTTQPVLTLYTCTPLFSVDKRLVVRAHRVMTPLAHELVMKK